MKKNPFRKLIAVLLAVVLLAVPLATCVSAQERKIPHIDFRGFMNDPVYADKNDPSSTQLWPPTSDNISALVKELLPAVAAFVATKDWDAFGDTLIPALNGLLEPLALNQSGDLQNNSGTYFVYPTKAEIEANDYYIPYTNDWRVDPFLAAQRLSNLIDYLTDDLGYPQVVLEGHSYAGIVMLTYLGVYGSENKVKACVFGASACYGAGFAGELINGEIDINGDALFEYLNGALDNGDMEGLLDPIIDMLHDAGIVDTLGQFVTELFANIGDRLYKESILPVLGRWGSIWAMVPDANIASGMNHVFNELAADVDYTVLQAKINHYNTVIRANRENILTSFNNRADTGLYVFSHYAYSGIPLSDKWNEMTDGVLKSTVTSFGAQFKNYDDTETFAEGKYVSPNGQVNGATAMFPDQTWYIRDAKHGLKLDELTEMARVLLYTDGQATVNTYEDYPQFMRYENNHIIADEGKDTSDIPQDQPDSVQVMERIRLFFESVLKLIIKAFKNLFSK